MNHLNCEKQMIEEAISGNQQALESLLCGVQDMVFNLSLRMLGVIPDAEDATQEILIKQYLKNKSWFLEYPITDHQLSNADAVIQKKKLAVSALCGTDVLKRS